MSYPPNLLAFSHARYFNAVGGIRFPNAEGIHTIAGKRGRMILFENYEDKLRPMHKTRGTASVLL